MGKISLEQIISNKFAKLFASGSNGIDRTGTYKTKPTAYPIPHCKETDDFYVLVDRRAKEYQQNVGVFWSGGIDSTMVLVALVKMNKNIILRCSLSSACEYPKLFFKILDNEYPNIKIEFEDEPYDDNVVYITGFCADQLLQRDSISFYKTELWQRPYEEAISSLQHKYLKPVVDKCPYKIVTLNDAWWWLNFTQKMDTSLAYYTKNYPQVKQINHFFFTDEFQQWAMSSKGAEVRSKVTNMYNQKQYLKEYIFEIFADDEYRVNKTKINSPFTTNELIPEYLNTTLKGVKENREFFEVLCYDTYRKEKQRFVDRRINRADPANKDKESYGYGGGTELEIPLEFFETDIYKE